jgi:hypothetical protein
MKRDLNLGEDLVVPGGDLLDHAEPCPLMATHLLFILHSHWRK